MLKSMKMFVLLLEWLFYNNVYFVEFLQSIFFIFREVKYFKKKLAVPKGMFVISIKKIHVYDFIIVTELVYTDIQSSTLMMAKETTNRAAQDSP